MLPYPKHVLIVALGFLFLTGLPSPSQAIPVLTVDSSGQLIGATGVNVGGTLFDVEFQDGTCIEFFDGCDAVSDFAFTTAADANAAAQALLDEVLVNSVGLFDDDPELTLGCSSPIECIVVIPFGFRAAGVDYEARSARNFSEEGPADIAPDDGLGGGPVTIDLRPRINATWAIFSPAIAVPEPGSLWLFGVGLAGLAFARRRQSGKRVG